MAAGFFFGIERDQEDLGVLALAEHLDLAQLLAERHLRGVVDVEVAEHEGAVGLERLEAGAGQLVVVQQAFLVDALHLGPHRGAELLGGDHSHALLHVLTGQSETLVIRE